MDGLRLPGKDAMLAKYPIPEEAKRPTKPKGSPLTMLDVHPAHHAATTWKDFFIHIATAAI